MRRTFHHTRQINQDQTTSESKWIRAAIFGCGDCLFLILISVTTTIAMHVVHQSGWHLAVVLPMGMAIGMVIQMLLAMVVAPVLGSIESMVPSMLVAMVVPMFVCLLDLIGVDMGERESLLLGAAGGLGGFLLLKVYGCRCRKYLCSIFPPQ